MMQNRPASANKIDACRFLIGISCRFKNTISAVAPLLRPPGVRSGNGDRRCAAAAARRHDHSDDNGELRLCAPVTMGNHPEGIAAAAIRVARRGLRVALRGRGDL
ncbi:hypothetical protein [Dactylosporangium darangshiense]|uniref:hypothetical protein n=1 Tax=Dactylosporangium darangshiense TaxID=579108 RepID=UPI0036318623